MGEWQIWKTSAGGVEVVRDGRGWIGARGSVGGRATEVAWGGGMDRHCAVVGTRRRASSYYLVESLQL